MTATPRKRIYLAGPDVFLPNAIEIAKAKQEICFWREFTGVSPSDNQLSLDKGSPFAAGLLIYEQNIKLMNSCDLIVANMTPFRGPSMDVGTAFELGYMAAQSKPLFGYSNDGRFYTDRVIDSGGGRDPEGLTIESFGMHDNLMLEGAISSSGGFFKTQRIASMEKHYYTDLTMFEEIIKIITELM